MKFGFRTRSVAAGILAIVAASSAAAATTHHHVGAHSGWTYRIKSDKLHDGYSRWACTRSTNLVRLGFPYHPQALELCLRSEPAAGVDVYFDLPAGGQFECLQGCDVEMRFDTTEATTLGADTPNDGSDDTIFLNDEQPFITSVLGAKRLVVGVTFYNAGDQQLTFDVAGLKWDAPKAAAPKPPDPEGPIVWIARPTADELASDYPEQARRMGVAGYATLSCSIGADGVPFNCTVDTQVPGDLEFGAAALKASRAYKVDVAASSLPPGDRVEITIEFTPKRGD